MPSPTPIFIGVGGTGQTVLAAYLRLARMAGFTPAPFYVVDSDTEGPLGTALTQLRSEVDTVIGGNPPSARWRIDPYPTIDVELKTFGGLFGNLAGDRQELFQCLFSEETEQTAIRRGMYGRPAIGATSIRYKILQEDDDLTELKDALRGGEKHVVLVGSCFGGTGSGGVPMLAQELAKLGEEPGVTLHVDAVVFLPWFRLVLPEGRATEEERALHERLNKQFEPNASAGIHYFRRQLVKHVDTLILLGVADRGRIERKSSESSQEEVPHILNLLAAMLVQNHFSGALEPPQGVAAYWYDPEEGLDPVDLLVSRENGRDSLSLSRVIHRTYLRAHWLKILATFFQSYGRIPRFYRPPLIDAALERLKGQTLSEQQVLGAIAENLSKVRERAEEHLDWIRQMDDEKLFPLPEGEERIESEKYDSKAHAPLRTVSTWCAEPSTVRRFQSGDFDSPEIFTEKLSSRFIDHLTEEFQL